MARRYDIVFFDVGFTLVYFEPSSSELTVRALHEAGVNGDPEVLMAAWREVEKRFNSQRATETYEASEAYDYARETALRRQVLARLGVHDEPTLQRYMEREEALYAQPGVIRLYPEVTSVLGRLRGEGYRLGVISNWSWNLRRRCEQVGIADAFDHIQGSAYSGCQKPHPGIFRQALAAMGVAPERAIHVGDDYEADVMGALGVGLSAALVDRGGRFAGNPAAPCDAESKCHIIRNLEELLPILG